MVVIIGRCIGNFLNVIGRIAHGHPQPGCLDHGAVVAGVTHGHRLLPAQTQMRRQRQQAAAPEDDYEEEMDAYNDFEDDGPPWDEDDPEPGEEDEA